MSVLTKTFFPLVSRHFMSFSLLSAWHSSNYLTLLLSFTSDTKDFAGLKAGIL